MADPYQPRRTMLKLDILARVSGGESVRAICREPGMPSARTVSDWGRADPRFRQDLWAAGQRRATRQISLLKRQLGRLQHRPGWKRR